MSEKNAYFDDAADDNDFIDAENDNEQLKILQDMEDPEEIEAAMEILSEEIDGPSDEDTPPSNEEPPEGDTSQEHEPEKEEKPKEDGAGESDGDEDAGGAEEDKPTGDDKDFRLTDELINKQPEDAKNILAKYKDKNKKEIAKAAASAIAFKNPITKDNEKVISTIAEQLEAKSTDDLLNILVDSQKGVGETGAPAAPVEEEPKPEPMKLELPKLSEDNEDLRSALEKEVLANLRKTKKYSNMPEVDSRSSDEYKEWLRDLNIDVPDNSFKEDLAAERKKVEGDLSRIVYIQQNLPNLYDENPSEVLPMLSEENLPRLKALNDDPMGLLVQEVQKEVGLIRKKLERYGLTEKDLGIDFTMTKDSKGNPYNEVLNGLILEGVENGVPIPRKDVINQHGETFWLQPGALARKFTDEYEPEILTAYTKRQAEKDAKERQKLKKETIKESGSGPTRQGGGQYTAEKIDKIQDPAEARRILKQLEKQDFSE